MERTRPQIFLLFVVVSVHISTTVVSGMLKNEVPELVDMKNKLQNALQQIQQVYETVNLMSTDLEGMCQTVQTQSCFCPDDSRTHAKDNQVSEKTDVTDSTEGKHNITITSMGVVDDNVTLEVQYSAPNNHSTSWRVSYNNGASLRLIGNTNSAESTITVDHGIYTNRIVLPDYNTTRDIAFIIDIAKRAHTQVYLNRDALTRTGNVMSIRTESFFINGLDDNYTAVLNIDLNITVKIEEYNNKAYNESSGFELEEMSVYAYFRGLKKSTNSSLQSKFVLVHDLSHSSTNGINVTKFKCGSKQCMSIVLNSTLVEIGGVLTVGASQWFGNDAPIQHITKTYYTYIIDPVNLEICPYPSMNMFPLANRTLAPSPGITLTCTSMGNPIPNMTILKINDHGLQEIPPDIITIISEFTVVKTVTVYQSEVKNANANYMCRASNGFYSENQTTEVMFVSKLLFDNELTKVIQNTSERIVVICKAGGSPQPLLQMRLYESYGPDLANIEGCQVQVNSVSNTTSILTLTISPVDSRIRTVYCRDTERYGPDSWRKLELYTDPDYPHKDWDWFYNLN